MYRMQYDTVAFWAGLVSFSCRSYNYRSICGHATGTLGTNAETWSGTASYNYRSIWHGWPAEQHQLLQRLPQHLATKFLILWKPPRGLRAKILPQLQLPLRKMVRKRDRLILNDLLISWRLETSSSLRKGFFVFH